MMRPLAKHPFLMALLMAGAAASSAAAAPMRAVQADLDYIYDADEAQTERNIDAFVERISAIHPTAIFLQAFADPKGTGLASALYFPNHALPMRADLFSRVAEELKQRTDVEVYGWLPVLSFALNDQITLVQTWSPKSGKIEPDPKAYRRVSPFDQKGVATIATIYEDMAKAAPIDGVLFHDDAQLSDFEDASPAALKAYRAAGLASSVKALRATPEKLKVWTAFKTDALINLTHTLTDHVRIYRPNVATARNLYAPTILDASSTAWFAQDYAKFLQAYDYTAVEAMPRLEKVDDAAAATWMQKLIDASAAQDHNLTHTLFELQTVDWNLAAQGKDRAMADETLATQMQFLVQQGALNLGYYPDDFVTDTPKLALLRQDFSLPTDPQTP